jgi:hypothetical protein
MKELIRPIIKNKANSQLSISIPKRKFPQLKGRNAKDPKFIKIKDIEFIE